MKDHRLYLIHIRECVDKALTYTAGLGRAWADQPMVFDAVCRNLEIIGEAANKLDDAYRLAHPQVAWRRIIGARHILAHAYDLLDPEVLQDVVERDLPVLREQILQLLMETPQPALSSERDDSAATGGAGGRDAANGEGH